MKAPTVWRRDVIGWSLYDFANTIYSMNIVSLYLKRYIVVDLGYDDRYYDIPFSISMLIAALVLPALGAMSDHGTKKKIFLLLFTITCCVAIGGLAFVPQGMIAAILILFIVANFSYEAGQPFYNALLYSVSSGAQARFVSGLGVALGYVGSVLGMVLVLPFVTGDVFGIDIPGIVGGGKQAAFMPTALLFALFAIPIFLWVKEKPAARTDAAGLITGYKDVWQGLRQTKRYPGVLRFLVADYFFEDAVATVILNIGLYCSIVLAMEEQMITLFLVISTVTAVLGSYVIGLVAESYSLKKLLNMIIVGWIFCLIMFVLVDTIAIVWVLGSLVGILLGGLWTVTRPLLAELVPPDELGRFFGLFSLSGRAAAVVGPLIWTTVVYLFSPDRILGQWTIEALGLTGDLRWLPYKLAVCSLAILMIIGLVIFRKVPDKSRGSNG